MIKDLSGLRFGKLIAIERHHQNKDNKWLWLCKCDCGNETIKLGARLVRGVNKSCGCKLIEWNNEQKEKSNPDKIIFRQYKKSAKERNLIFSLSFEQFSKLIHLSCHYCGIIPKNRNGIDRKNNDIGYTNYNSLPCCFICNRAKGAMTYEQFSNYLDRFTQTR